MRPGGDARAGRARRHGAGLRRGARGRARARVDEPHRLGNPLRFEHGPLTIRPDDEWLTSIDPGDSRLVTALTWPLLMRYGCDRSRAR